ncbi:MAG: hypothetical protein ABL936_00455 [Aestuariivirga sp.]
MLLSENAEDDISLAVQGFTFLQRDPITGVETFFRTNDDGSTTIYYRSDVTELLEVNKATFTETKNRKLGDWAPLGRFDDITMQNTNLSRAINEGDRKYVKRVLNDGDLAKFRTSDLKV